MKRTTRDRLLSPHEAANYQAVRDQVAAELPDLIARHHARTMHFEVEQKFRLADARELIAQVAKLGGAFGEPIEQVDLYFNHPSRDFAQTDEAVRIRRVGERAFVTYKGPKLDAATKTRRELELPLAAGTAEGFAELLAALGFRRTAEVRKLRRIAEVECQGRSFEIALDDVAGVGVYAELETSAAEAELPAARAALAELAGRLELTANERRSYLELLLAAGRGRESFSRASKEE